jgi:RHH-type proline utilization regulon transcriptional repressor/proline dehydrogenase/delta 1-pyrroline-5-carboxylate dehydrogenase
MLCDAVKSLHVGSAWELHTRVNPLIRPPGDDLESAFKTLEPGESWAVLPRQAADNANLWSPGVKYGVRPGSITHCTEFFGPMLGVMRFERLDEAIALVNQTGYGLTCGLHSLDEREHAQWKAGVHAGNLYLNRGTTGAVVLRQPFGGMARSSFGPGLKAGGPNYVAQFMKFEEAPASTPADAPVTNENLEGLRRSVLALANDECRMTNGGMDPRAPAHSSFIIRHSSFIRDSSSRLLQAIASYDLWWREEFSREHDHFQLLGQDNFRRYLPFDVIRVRVAPQDTAFDVFARACAARVTGARVVVSSPGDAAQEAVRLLDELTDSWAAAIEFVEESDEQLAAHLRALPAHATERIRYAAPVRVPEGVRAVAAAAGVYLADEPVLAEGRIELLWYLREQSLCHDYHRYGNLGARGAEARKEPS